MLPVYVKQHELTNRPSWIQKYGGVGYIRDFERKATSVLRVNPRRGFDDDERSSYRGFSQNFAGCVARQFDELQSRAKHGLMRWYDEVTSQRDVDSCVQLSGAKYGSGNDLGSRKCVPRRRSMESASIASSWSRRGVITRPSGSSTWRFIRLLISVIEKTDNSASPSLASVQLTVLKSLKGPALELRGEFAALLQISRVLTDLVH
jgi:hypothetical protein